MSKKTVYFATNRNLLPDDAAPFGNRYHPDRPFFFRVGWAEVEKIDDPWEHPDEAYVLNSVSVAEERAPREPNDKRQKLGSSEVFAELQANMGEEYRDALVFIHGFSSTFEGALLRAAELKDGYMSPGTGLLHFSADDRATNEKLKKLRAREPMVFAFAWPSDGTTFGLGTAKNEGEIPKWAYFSDRDDAEASGKAMARALLRLIEFLKQANERGEPCRQRLHLVAHSMGNWALRHALQAMRQQLNNARLPRIFDNIILAAADEDDDALEHDHKLGLLPQLARNISVYYSRTDAALTVSDYTKFNPDRLGENGPRTFSGLSTNIVGLDCTDVDDTPVLSHAGHQYYRLSPEVLRDIRAVLSGQSIDDIDGRVVVEPGRRYRLKRDKAARGET